MQPSPCSAPDQSLLQIPEDEDQYDSNSEQEDHIVNGEQKLLDLLNSTLMKVLPGSALASSLSVLGIVPTFVNFLGETHYLYYEKKFGAESDRHCSTQWKETTAQDLYLFLDPK